MVFFVVCMKVFFFEEKYGLWFCMVVLMKIMVGFGMLFGIDIFEVLGVIGDYSMFFMFKVVVMVNVFLVFLNFCFNVFVSGEDGYKLGSLDGYDFGFFYMKVNILFLFFNMKF